MSPSFSKAKFVSAYIATRRGFASASATRGVALRNENEAPTMTKNISSEDTAKAAWVPDPITGIYRPDYLVKETAPAELREMLIEYNKNIGL